jgi:hypothetical protein
LSSRGCAPLRCLLKTTWCQGLRRGVGAGVVGFDGLGDVPPPCRQVLGVPTVTSWGEVDSLSQAAQIRSWKSGFPRESQLKEVRGIIARCGACKLFVGEARQSQSWGGWGILQDV